MSRLDGQAALVTGASSGIGRGIALAMGAAGAAVVVNYHNDATDARAVADAIVAAGGRAVPVQADVSREDEVLKLFDTARAELGTLDIVVANAGVQRDAAFDAMTLKEWQTVIDINLTGQFLCLREAVREFKRRGPRPEVSRALGKIICMSSVHETIPWAGHVNYAAAKGGVMMLMKSVAQEYASLGIRANSIAPGAIRTAINRAAWETPEAHAALLQLIPNRRVGEPEDVAGAAVWLASDDSDYVTGTTLFIDGGMTLYPGFEGGG